MLERTKIVELAASEPGGQPLRLQVGRLSPEFGSFVLMRMLHSSLVSAQQSQAAAGGQVQDVQQVAEQEPPEMVARRFVTGALLTNDNRELHRQILSECLRVSSELKVDKGDLREVALPLCTADGTIANIQIRESMSIHTQLMIECMVFNFTDFFGQGGLRPILQAPPPTR